MHDVSTVELLKGAVRDAQELVRAEIALAKTEARAEIKRVGAGVALLAGAAIFAVIGVVLLLTTVAWAISEGLGWPVWAGFGIVTLLVLIAMGALAYIGLGRLRSERHMPLTVDTFKESMQWMRARTS
jgi:hypothetical protein